MKSLVKYDPSYLGVFDDIDRMFNSFFDLEPTWTRTPAVDIREESDKYLLEAELTGLSEKDVDVKVQDNLLTISSKKSEQTEEKKNGYLVKERRHSSFSRSFVLPKDADRDKIEASFKNGLLALSIPKLPEAQPKSITVKVS